jgi:hypothetical protein
MIDPRVTAGLDLWAVVTRLIETPGLLRPRQQVDLRTAAVRAIAALNGRTPAPGFMLPAEDLRGIFIGIAAELQARGASEGDLSRWLDDTNGQRAVLARQRGTR